MKAQQLKLANLFLHADITTWRIQTAPAISHTSIKPYSLKFFFFFFRKPQSIFIAIGTSREAHSATHSYNFQFYGRFPPNIQPWKWFAQFRNHIPLSTFTAFLIFYDLFNQYSRVEKKIVFWTPAHPLFLSVELLTKFWPKHLKSIFYELTDMRSVHPCEEVSLSQVVTKFIRFSSR